MAEEKKYSKQDMIDYAWFFIENKGQTTHDKLANKQSYYLNLWEQQKKSEYFELEDRKQEFRDIEIEDKVIEEGLQD